MVFIGPEYGSSWRAIAAAIKVLEEFSDGEEGMTAHEIAELAFYAPKTLRMALSAAAHHGLVERCGSRPSRGPGSGLTLWKLGPAYKEPC